MPIKVVAKPEQLSWSNFSERDKVIDPNDKTEVSAVTGFEREIPGVKPRNVDGKLAFPEDLEIIITPDAAVRKGVTKSDKLLSHEQFHYDVGIASARVIAHKLQLVRGNKISDLDTAQGEIEALHDFRTKLIHRAYDRETRHGRNEAAQRSWKKLMEAVLAKPGTTQIGGWWL
jgi:hypothetical protein